MISTTRTVEPHGGRSCIPGLCAIVIILLQGCASLPERTPIPQESYNESLVLGLPGLRFWGDEVYPLAEDLPPEPTLEELQAALPGFVGREVRILAISGGGR